MRSATPSASAAAPAAAQDGSTARLIARPWFWRSVALCSAVAFLAMWPGGSTDPAPLRGKHKKVRGDDEHDQDLHKIFHGREGENRCQEDGEEEAPSNCPCLDPLVPKARDDDDDGAWMKHHQLMQEQVKNVKDIDVVFIGDSLVERWRGTARMGGHPLEGYREVFDTYFNKTAGGKLDGLALGSAGDVTPNALWHLENGFIPKEMNPKLFYLSIGTNDLSLQHGCSKKTVLVGILHVADTLHKLRPDVPILFHGLLPRLGPQESPASSKMGGYWQKIMWINREVKTFAKLHKNWYYMDSALIFLERDKVTGDVVLKKNLMPDGLHPNVEGYERWGKRISSNIEKLLEKHKSG